MATNKNAERKKNLSKDKNFDDFGGYLFTAAERKEIEARTKKAIAAQKKADAKKKGKK